jgi:hypothetical protein
VPALNETGAARIALEAFPGFLVGRLGERYYKNDKPRSAAANSVARGRIIDQLRDCRSDALSCSLALGSKRLGERLLHASGDWLDAVLCAVQAHWGWLRKDANFGLPEDVDPVEGWIVTA